MLAPGSDSPVAGICHARGANASLPVQWLVYVQVENVEASARRAQELGGSVVDGPRGMGSFQFCVIRDPAGAVLALVSP
jgi:predicted enzyme related to lactoylglutathione lyase